MKKYLKSWYDRLVAPLATKADIDNLYVQLSCLLEVREIVGRSTPLGPLRGWAMSPDALLIVLRDLIARSDPRVLEFGSGESTVAIAGALKALGSGSLTSIEHDENFSAHLGKRLQLAGLTDRVDLRVVPLASYESRFGLPAFKSYDLSGQACEFDVALVDGPITPYFGAGTRSVPLEWSLARLNAGGAIYLDDAGRREEQAVVDALRASCTTANFELIATEKGFYRMTSGGRGG